MTEHWARQLFLAAADAKYPVVMGRFARGRVCVFLVLLAMGLGTIGPIFLDTAMAGQPGMAAAPAGDAPMTCPDCGDTMPAMTVNACPAAFCVAPTILPSQESRPDRAVSAYFPRLELAVAGFSPAPDPGPPRFPA